MQRFATNASIELPEASSVVRISVATSLAARMGLGGRELRGDSCLALFDLTGLSQIESIEPETRGAELAK
jgi:hypothetical protein